MPWAIILDPIAGEQKGANLAGLLVKLVKSGGDWDDYQQEVSAVAFARQNSRSPDVSFDDALQAEIDKARLAIEAIEQFEDELTALRAADEKKAMEQARKQIKEVFGPSRSKKPA